MTRFHRIVSGLARRLPFGHLLERVFLYRDPRGYWEQRGGERYFREQENAPQRAAKAKFLAKELAGLGAQSILELGCGYGKQLGMIAGETRAKLFGLDFSQSQLHKAGDFLPKGTAGLSCGDAGRLPYKDKSVDVVFTSAVILHNPPKKAEEIVREACRVARRFVVHNEDTDVSFSRYGIDVAAIHRRLGKGDVRVKHIPVASDPSRTQFTVVSLEHAHRD